MRKFLFVIGLCLTTPALAQYAPEGVHRAPYKLHQAPTVNDNAYYCNLRWEELRTYENRAWAAVRKISVDERGGYVEYPDQSNLFRDMDIALIPWRKAFRLEMLTASKSRCDALRDGGKSAINGVLKKYFK